MKLETERLELILLDARQLRLWLDDLPVLEKELQCVYDAETMDAAFARILRGQARAAEQDPYNLCWRSFWWMVEKTATAWSAPQILNPLRIKPVSWRLVTDWA